MNRAGLEGLFLRNHRKSARAVPTPRHRKPPRSARAADEHTNINTIRLIYWHLPNPRYMCRRLSTLSGVHASASETLMERSYDPKRSASIFLHRTLSARRLVRSQQTVSAAHPLSTHGSPSFIDVLTCTCTISHCFHWNTLGQGLRPCHRKPPRCRWGAALRRRPVSRTQHHSSNNKRDVHYRATRSSLNVGV